MGRAVEDRTMNDKALLKRYREENEYLKKCIHELQRENGNRMSTKCSFEALQDKIVDQPKDIICKPQKSPTLGTIYNQNFEIAEREQTCQLQGEVSRIEALPTLRNDNQIRTKDKEIVFLQSELAHQNLLIQTLVRKYEVEDLKQVSIRNTR